jgi:hypothetical protein
MPACCRLVHTPLAPIRSPSRHSWPCTRREPQVGFSLTSRGTQATQLGRHGRTATPVWVGPAAPDQVAMPAQQRGRLHEQLAPGWTGQQPHQPGQHRPACPVRPVHPRPGHLAWQHRDLLPQHQQIGVLGCRTLCQQREPAQQPAEPAVEQSHGQAPIIAADGFLDELAAQPVGCVNAFTQLRALPGESAGPVTSTHLRRRRTPPRTTDTPLFQKRCGRLHHSPGACLPPHALLPARCPCAWTLPSRRWDDPRRSPAVHASHGAAVLVGAVGILAHRKRRPRSRHIGSSVLSCPELAEGAQ